MAEEHEFRQFVDTARWNGALSHFDMAGAALRERGKACSVAGFSVLMASHALQLQSGMFAVREGWVFCSADCYGKEKASNASEYLSLYLLPPPAAITMYCFFVFGE